MAERPDPLMIAAAIAASPPIHRQAGGMSIGTTDDGRIVRLPQAGTMETQLLATMDAPNGIGYTNVPTLFNGVPATRAQILAALMAGRDPDTGKGFQSFGSIADAERSAIARSQAREPELLGKYPWAFDDGGRR